MSEISKETFEGEINLCQKMYKKKAGCAWGRCNDCAVIPLLVKLYEGKIVEDKEEVLNLKDSFLKQV